MLYNIMTSWNPTPAEIDRFHQQVIFKLSVLVCPGHSQIYLVAMEIKIAAVSRELPRGIKFYTHTACGEVCTKKKDLTYLDSYLPCLH